MSADLLAAFGGEEDRHNDGLIPQETKSNLHEVVPRPRPLHTVQKESKFESQNHQLWQKDHQGQDILFDASDASQISDDDFGDFAGPEEVDIKQSSTSQNVDSVDLLGIEGPISQDHQTVGPSSLTGWAGMSFSSKPIADTSVSLSKLQASSQGLDGRDEADDEWGDFEAVDQAKPASSIIQHSLKHDPARMDRAEGVFDDEPWDAFEDGPAQPAQTHVELNEQSKTSSIDLTASSINTPDVVTKVRPTNVPPPYSLLQLLVIVVQRLSLHGKTTSPAQILSLGKQIIALYRTTSRILAGRQHRWKRDNILAQSMRISEASHKNTGMKLTSLDRSESIKENQEAIEVVATWTRHSHALNPILLKAKIQKPAMSLSADLKTRAINGPGTINEREPCAICGMKRNERIIGIDNKIDDIFDEFWIEHWGHSECRAFWFEHKTLLAQR